MRPAIRHLTVLILLFMHQALWAAPPAAPDRVRGEGPFDRLLLRGVTVINGEGAPPVGPMDVVIEGNRIVSIHAVGYPGMPIDESGRPAVQDGDPARRRGAGDGRADRLDPTGQARRPGGGNRGQSTFS